MTLWQKKESLSVIEKLSKIVLQYSPNKHVQRKNICCSQLAFRALLYHVEQMIFQVISKILYKSLKLCEAFNLALDESTDISDTVELAICIRIVTVGLDVVKKYLDMASLSSTTTGHL